MLKTSVITMKIVLPHVKSLSCKVSPVAEKEGFSHGRIGSFGRVSDGLAGLRGLVGGFGVVNGKN